MSMYVAEPSAAWCVSSGARETFRHENRKAARQSVAEEIDMRSRTVVRNDASSSNHFHAARASDSLQQFERQGCSFGDISGRATAEHHGQMTRVQAVSRANGAHVVWCERLAVLDVRNGEERAFEDR